ncbi:MAG: ABC transporter permease [Planctomycetota bacterium]
MRYLWICALKDLQRQLRDPVAILIWCGIPLLIATLMTLAFGGAGGAPQVHLLIVDEDDSLLSNLLAGAFGRAGDLFQVERVDRAEGRSLIDGGKASALLIIPEGFGVAVLKERPATLELVTNPAQRVLPGIVESTLGVMVDGTFYIQQILGGPLRAIAEGPPGDAHTFPNETIIDLSVEINEIAERVVRFFDPLAIALRTEVEESSPGPRPGFGEILFPGILFMALLFVAQGMSEDLWREREQGTLRRLLASPRGLSIFLGGKLLAAGIFIALVCIVGLLVGATAFDLALARLPAALGWATVSGVVLLTLFMFLQLLGSTRRGASILSNMVLFPLMMIGGSFFPFEAMPSWMVAVGRFSPNGWALVKFKAILGGTSEPGSLLITLAGLLGLGALLFMAGIARMRRRFTTA